MVSKKIVTMITLIASVGNFVSMVDSSVRLAGDNTCNWLDTN